MRLSDIMTKGVRVISAGDDLREAARIMDDLNVGVLPVSDGGRLAGMITDRDIVVRAVSAGRSPERTPVGDIMSGEVFWCHEDEPVEAAERLMAEKQVRRIPVLDGDKRLVGIVSLGDIATRRAAKTEDTLRSISEPSAPDLLGTPSTRRARSDWSGRPGHGRILGERAWAEVETRLSEQGGEFHGGYNLRDQNLWEQVVEELNGDPMLDATRIGVRVADGEVTLTGTVGSAYDRRRAEDAARSVAGVRRVENGLQIVEPSMAELELQSATTEAPDLTER